MKYVVNTRGRAMAKKDEEAERLISQGFIEITQSQFEQGTYFPEFDKGFEYKTATTRASQKVSPLTVIARNQFETKVV